MSELGRQSDAAPSPKNATCISIMMAKLVDGEFPSRVRVRALGVFLS
jgi:hypothetical protein